MQIRAATGAQSREHFLLVTNAPTAIEHSSGCCGGRVDLLECCKNDP